MRAPILALGLLLLALPTPTAAAACTALPEAGAVVCADDERVHVAHADPRTGTTVLCASHETDPAYFGEIHRFPSCVDHAHPELGRTSACAEPLLYAYPAPHRARAGAGHCLAHENTLAGRTALCRWGSGDAYLWIRGSDASCVRHESDALGRWEADARTTRDASPWLVLERATLSASAPHAGVVAAGVTAAAAPLWGAGGAATVTAGGWTVSAGGAGSTWGSSAAACVTPAGSNPRCVYLP